MNLKKFKILLVVPVFLVLANSILGFYRAVKSEINSSVKIKSNEILEEVNTIWMTSTDSSIDWNNYELMLFESKQTGKGEQGKSEFLTDMKERNLDNQLFKFFGASAVVSQKISLNRSIPDLRSDEFS